MRPLDLKTGFLRVVFLVLLTFDAVLITGQERAVISVAFSVVRRCSQAPRAFRIDFANQLQVDLIIDGKIVTTITQVETSLHLITVSRHDQTTGVAFRKGEEAIRHS